jgi:hypothetical protein
MLELPGAVDLDVVVFVARRQPYRLIRLAQGEWPEKMPDAVGLVALHLDPRIEDIMLGKADPLVEAPKELPQLIVPFGQADALPFPDAVFRKNPDDPIRKVGS